MEKEAASALLQEKIGDELKTITDQIKEYLEILASKEKAKCIIQTEVPMCDDSERRIARELFGFENLTPCGDEKPWDREHPNALRSQHVRMIQSLLDNGYAYTAQARIR